LFIIISFPVMALNKPSRYPSRSTNEQKIVYEIIDEGLFCTIAFIRDRIPQQIPTGYFRIEGHLYIHASAKSHFINDIIGNNVSFSVTHMDALVLAPTAFDHSFNYRSVIGFSRAEEVTDHNQKKTLFSEFTDRYIPGRIADVGEPSEEQIAVTKIVKLSLSDAIAKVRNGDVNVKLNDKDAWCGIIPLNWAYGVPQIDHQLSQDKKLPTYINRLINGG